MGKKTRPAVGTAVGRRTILQLSPPPGIRVAVGGREEAGSGSEDEQEAEGHPFLKNTMRPPAPAAKAPEGLSLLGAYEDSEDEDSGDNPPPAVKTQLNQSADILANFMAEIDAITTQPSTEDQASSSPPGPEAKAQQPTPEEGEQQPSTVAAVTAFQYDTQYSLAGVGVEMGDWQEVWDDTSGCHYYWNTLTNEVAWELPHYLADQVQGLQQAADRSVVNGNGTTPTTGCVTEPDPASGPELKKEPKKKEVMESVVALRSEEEERCGVAASLLGPLIPSDVKESEEKWRKTLLSLPEAADDEEEEEEEETSVDSDGEDSVPGSPATPPHEPDALPADKKQLPSRAQSEENSAAEEETEEDTMELELALERKKAELRALEEGDGRSGGSSPCSEASQDASPGPRAVPVKKARWKTAFVLAASPESNSRSSDAPENTDTANCKIPEKLLEADEKEADKMEEKTVTKALVKEEVETPELKFQIGELANTLTSKMEFLEINKKTISNLHLLLLQTETRIADWREGALSGTYLRRRLLEAAEHIKLSELNATPKGWSCHWDREHRRYFYVNDRTSASQWDFPVEEEEEEDDEEEEEEEHTKGPPVTQTAGQGEPKPPPSGPTPPSPAPAPPPPAPIPAGVTEWSSFTPVAPADPPQPPLPDSPPPPPPPPASPPPPPPPPDSDGEIMEVEMEMDDDEGEPPAPGTEEDTGGRPPLPVVAKVVESSVPLGKGLKRKAGLPTKAATIGSNAIIYTQPAPAAAAAPVMSASSYWTAMAVPSLPAETPAPPLPPLPSQPPLPSAQPPCDPPGVKTLPTDKTKKLKKDKSKKSKIKMPSLVQKWQSIQKELDEEEKSSSSDEDRTQLNKRNIEDWRKQQLLTGKAGKNANFEALPDNWRERLKKRKMMNNT